MLILSSLPACPLQFTLYGRQPFFSLMFKQILSERTFSVWVLSCFSWWVEFLSEVFHIAGLLWGVQKSPSNCFYQMSPRTPSWMFSYYIDVCLYGFCVGNPERWLFSTNLFGLLRMYKEVKVICSGWAVPGALMDPVHPGPSVVCSSLLSHMHT
jgi:hypothetical protein